MSDQFSNLLALLERLHDARIAYWLSHFRSDSIAVEAMVPGARWEIEFMSDGTVEIEVYSSDGSIENEKKLDEFFRLYGD